MKKLALLILSVLCICCFTLGLTACNNKKPTDSGNNSGNTQSQTNNPSYGNGSTDSQPQQNSSTGTEPTAKHEHSYGEWLFDETNHWKECGATEGECDAKTADLAKHTLDSQTNVCTVCGQTIIEGQLTFAEIKEGENIVAYSVTGLVPESETATFVTIPSEYNEKPVTQIDEHAFENCTSLMSVDIPNSIISIGRGAFSNCTNLKSVTIGSGVTFSSDYAFYNCTSLTKVNITDLSAWCKIEFEHTTYNEFSSNPLYYSNKLYLNGELITNLVIPSDVTSISGYAFINCRALISVTIGSSVTSIGENAFRDCNKLVEVYNLSSLNITIGDYQNGQVGECALNVYTSIGTPSKLSTTKDGYVFYERGEDVYLICYNGTGTNLVLPDKFNDKNYRIYSYAFSDNTNITSITIPNSITFIGESAFKDCKGLTSVNITDLSAWCQIEFADTYSNPLFYANNLYLNKELVTNLVIPNNVSFIRNYAFLNCRSLSSITLPASVVSIGTRAFGNCENLTSITVDPNNNSYYSENNCIITTGSKALILGCKNSVIPDGVTSIADQAFSSCTGLTKINLPDSVTSIGICAFFECYNLTTITIPANMTEIADYAFYGCLRLVEVYNLSSLNITKGGYGNGQVGNFALNVYTSKDTPSKLSTTDDGYIFYENDEEVYLVGYNGTETNLVLPDKFNDKNYEIYQNAFIYRTDITGVTIGNGVSIIDDGAFAYCKNLTNVTLGDSVTEISTEAFLGCNSIKYNEYDNALYLGSKDNPYLLLMQAKKSSITSCDVNENTKSINFSAFYGCKELTNITIGSSVKYVEPGTFDDCDKLENVYYKGDLSDYPLSVNHNYHLYIWNGENYSEPTSAIISISKVEGLRNIQSLKEITLLYDSNVSQVEIPWLPSLEKLNLEYFENEIIINGLSQSVQTTYGYNFKKGSSNGFEYVTRGNSAMITAYSGKSDQVILPTAIEGATITKLGAIFKGNSTIKEVIIPEGYTDIADETFYNCTALRLLYIPSTIKNMGENVLYNINMPIYVGNGLGAGQFKLAPNTIYAGYSTEPTEWTRWRDKAYFTHYDSMFDINSSMIYQRNSEVEITRYCGTEEKVTIPSKINGKQVVAIGGDSAFYERTYVKEVTVSEGVTVIKPVAFYGCTGLTKISLPQSLGQIGQQSFDGCTSLESITIPANVYSIAYYAFKNCLSLSSVTFEEPNGWIVLEMKQNGSVIEPTQKVESPNLTDTSQNATYLGRKYLFWVWMNQDKIPK